MRPYAPHGRPSRQGRGRRVAVWRQTPTRLQPRTRRRGGAANGLLIRWSQRAIPGLMEDGPAVGLPVVRGRDAGLCGPARRYVSRRAKGPSWSF